MDALQPVRKHLEYLLKGGGAHVHFPDVLDSFPVALCGRQVEGVPYTAWQLLEHMRIAQWDILEFSRNPAHVSPPWPEGYWPDAPAPSEPEAWQQSLQQFYRDLEQMIALVLDPEVDLLAPIPHGQGQTILREALLVADHNAYHLGQLVLLRRLLGTWPGSSFAI
ncbi:MAG: DinB family protein [Calditrichaeota bacterium]|nr:MAG: DinB family protein [Calditrichota bacterium]